MTRRSLLDGAKEVILKSPLLRRLFRDRVRWSDGNKLVTCLQSNGIDLVVDVGANVGQTHDLLRLYGYHGDVLSIEPVASAHATLVRRSASDDRWLVAPRMAIGAERGRATIHVARASDLSSLRAATDTLRETYPGSEAIRAEEVDVLPLDEVLAPYLDRYSSVFVKVDTQGFEDAVLAGSRASLDRIRGIQLELSLVPLYRGEPSYLPIMSQLREHGFEPHLILETNFSFHLRRQIQFDLVAFRTPRSSDPPPST